MTVKKWILIVSFLLVLVLGICIKIYLNAVEPVKAAESKAVKIAQDEANISTVSDFSIYNGHGTYFIVTGENKQKEKIIVWIPEKKGDVIIKKESDGISKQKAIDIVTNEKHPKEIVTARLGYEKKFGPVWEIYYRSNNDLMNYYYLHFETGEWVKVIENL